MYSYFLSSEAKEDIREIYNYGVHKFGINQADTYFNLLHDCFDRIEANPFLFPSANHIKEDYRYCVCMVDTIYFRIIKSGKIEIITIIGRQDYSK
jgi:toxin ParE1/3/4